MPIIPWGRLRLGRFLVDVLIVAGALLLLVEGGLGAFGADWSLRLPLLLLGAALDLVFTLEFALRLGAAYYAGSHGDYLGEGGGWLEGLSSLPLLAFVSGPLLFAAISAGSGALPLSDSGGTTTPIFAQALASLAPLRLLRLLRLRRGGFFRASTGIGENGVIRRRALLSAFFALLLLGFLVDLARAAGAWPGYRAAMAEKRLSTFGALEKAPGADGAEAASGSDGALLLVRVGGRVVYTRYPAALYPKVFGPEDIAMLGRGGIEAYFSLATENRARAAASFAASLAVLAVFAALLLGLGPAAPRPSAPRPLSGQKGFPKAFPGSDGSAELAALLDSSRRG